MPTSRWDLHAYHTKLINVCDMLGVKKEWLNWLVGKYLIDKYILV